MPETMPAAVNRTTSLYGLRLRWAEPGPNAVGEDSSVALVRERSSFPNASVEWLSEADDGRPALGVADGGYAYRFPGIADFLLPRDGSVRIFLTASADRFAVEFALFRGVLPRLLHLRGIPCLHASAVRVGTEVVAFVGRSGAGKSSLAAGLTARGFPLVTDDVLPLRTAGDRGTVVAGPGLHELRLYAGAGAAAGVAAQLVQPGPGQAKGRWIPATDRVARDPAPLAGVYLLRPLRRRGGCSPPARLGRRLKPRDALLALIEHSTWLHARETEALGNDLLLFAAIARSVPVHRLSCELSPAGFAEVERLLAGPRSR